MPSTTRAEVIGRVADGLVTIPVRHTLRVAIDGITGSGKTTFARELAEAVNTRGRTCVQVSMDGFHQPRAMRYRQGDESADGYYDDAYDFGALRSQLLDPLGPTGSGHYRTAVIDLTTDQPVDGPVEPAPPGLVVIVDGSFLQRRAVAGGWDAVVFLRSSFEAARARGAARDAVQLGSLDNALRRFDVRYHAAQRRYLAEVDPEANADIVIDHDDPRAPAIVRIAPELTRFEPHLRRTRQFFGPRAASWETRFDGDEPAYRDAIGALALPRGAVALDLGCGTGRALPMLRDAVGSDGLALGVDATSEMLRAASAAGRGDEAALVLGDVTRLPVKAGSVDAIFAAGILGHVPDPLELLRSLARVAKPGGRLAIFHPIGRAALARRHQRELRPEELLDPRVLPGVLAAAGWTVDGLDDSEARYLALSSASP